MLHSLRGRLLVAATVVLVSAVAAGGSSAKNAPNKLDKIDHIVVIYEENHSFDNLYGTWEGVDGVANADAAHTAQIGQNGRAYTCLVQNDVNLALLATGCTTGYEASSAFPNGPFLIDSYIPSSATTCPNPNGKFAPNGFLNGTGLPGGCTKDIVHRYYQEQFQIDGGKQDRYVQGSDAVGLVMGRYDTQSLPIYAYLHQPNAPHYAIADRFFQGAFGGSYLNHIYLVSASAQLFGGALNDGSANDFHSVVDENGMPNNYPLYHSPLGAGARDNMLTASCAPPTGRPATPAGVVCGDYAVNTTQPWAWPFSPGTADVKRQQPLTTPNIGSELSAKGVDWAWYSGGWSNANGYTDQPGWTNGSGPTCTDPDARGGSTWPKCPDVNFQYHHQPFNYWAAYQSGPQRAAHLQDEKAFVAAADGSTSGCGLKAVSFVKPVGEENEHPGYTSETRGSNHLVELLQSIEGSACAKDTMVVVTYDEFGGQWDHVSPPGPGSATPGPYDEWGPGTRLPALILAPGLPGNFVVDHTSHDTSSILATIEHRFDVPALSTRDATVADLSTVFDAKQVAGK